MASKPSPIIFFLLALISIQLSYGQDVVKGGYWFPDSGIQVSDIDSTLFTHLFCAFAKLDPQTNQLIISSECSTFTQVVQQNSPSVKTLLSIGGGAAASSDFNSMASQPTSRQAFIESSIKLARSNGFHGLDLDWEHQTMTSEMDNMGLLLDDWRAAVNSESSSTGSQALILTAAVAVSPQIDPETSFPTQAISRSLDWVNVMAYDMTTPGGSAVTGAPAALNNPSGGASGSSGISAWINAGVSSKKLVLGLPFYGYAWKLADPSNHGLLAPANGIDGSVGSPEDGSIAYNKIKEFISENGATVVYDSNYVTNYCYSGTTWIGYDDVQSISAKVSYAKMNASLLGYFAWHVAADDNWALSKQALQAWGP